MTVGELRKALSGVPPVAEVVLAESESAITDDFLPVAKIYRLQHYDEGEYRDSIVLIEQTGIK